MLWETGHGKICNILSISWLESQFDRSDLYMQSGPQPCWQLSDAALTFEFVIASENLHITQNHFIQKLLIIAALKLHVLNLYNLSSLLLEL